MPDGKRTVAVGILFGLIGFLLATVISRAVDAFQSRGITDYLFSYGVPWKFAFVGGIAGMRRIVWWAVLADLAFFLLLGITAIWLFRSARN